MKYSRRIIFYGGYYLVGVLVGKLLGWFSLILLSIFLLIALAQNTGKEK